MDDGASRCDALLTDIPTRSLLKMTATEFSKLEDSGDNDGMDAVVGRVDVNQLYDISVTVELDNYSDDGNFQARITKFTKTSAATPITPDAKNDTADPPAASSSSSHSKLINVPDSPASSSSTSNSEPNKKKPRKAAPKDSLCSYAAFFIVMYIYNGTLLISYFNYFISAIFASLSYFINSLSH